MFTATAPENREILTNIVKQTNVGKEWIFQTRSSDINYYFVPAGVVQAVDYFRERLLLSRR